MTASASVAPAFKAFESTSEAICFRSIERAGADDDTFSETSTSLDSTNRGCRGPRLPAIRSLQKIHAGRTVLGVALEFVFDVRGRAVLGTAFEDLHGSAAIHATELGVVVLQCDRDGLHLPERFITTGCANAAALHFTLVKP